MDVQDWIKDIKPPVLRASMGGEGIDRSLFSTYKDKMLVYMWRKDIGNVKMASVGSSNWVRGKIIKRNKDEDNKKYNSLDDYRRVNKNVEVLDEEETDKVWTKYRNQIKRLGELVAEKKGKSVKTIELRKDLKFEEKKEVLKCIKELHDLNKDYDLRFLEVDDTMGLQSFLKGVIDLFIQNVSYLYINLFMEDPEMKEEMSKSKVAKEKRAEALKDITKEDGSYEIPSLLHFDEAAYRSISDIAEGKTFDIVKLKLKGLDFSNEKIEAVQERCKQLKKFLEDTAKKAEAFYLLAGWDTNTPQGQFFIKEHD